MSNAFSKPVYIYKRFRVKRADGGSTTVSVDPALVVQAVKALGSLSAVGGLVRESALKYDPAAENAAKNRSAHVTRTLKKIVDDKGRSAPQKTTEHVDPVNESGADEVEAADDGDEADDVDYAEDAADVAEFEFEVYA